MPFDLSTGLTAPWLPPPDDSGADRRRYGLLTAVQRWAVSVAGPTAVGGR
jgi:hypothetical protein